jgi:hypothetical protein
MSEKWAGISAEKKYLIENEVDYFSTLQFVENPVDFLSELREHYIDGGYAEASFATEAISRIFEMEVVIDNEEFEVVDERLKAHLDAENNSEQWAVNLFSLLKSAGYTQAEILTYVELDDPEFSHEERLQERGLKVYLNKVYGE